MKQRIIPIILITAAVVLGAVVVISVFTKPKGQPQPNAATTVRTAETSDNPYATLKGEEFDEAFVADMLAHHEGAVNMSEQAQAKAQHDELKDLAATIMQDQSVEINEMKQWQQEWGFEETMGAGHMSHGGDGMDMAGDMTEMMNSLDELSGEAFDKEYLAQMIEHHQQAIDMSRFAAKNAGREEIKDLARTIIRTQQIEIRQMEKWQRLWGYV